MIHAATLWWMADCGRAQPSRLRQKPTESCYVVYYGAVVPSRGATIGLRQRQPSSVRLRLCAFVTGLLVFSAAGCGGSHVSLQKVRPTSPSQPSGTGSLPGTLVTDGSPQPNDGQDPAIVASYEASLADFVQVATKAPVQINGNLLTSHMGGDRLKFVTGALLKLASEGHVDSGSLSSVHAKVIQYSASNASGFPQAIVQACLHDDISVANAANGEIVGRSSHSTQPVEDLLQLSAGAWKVMAEADRGAGCA